ncbi:hypothetical protein [Bacilliculturomica massiliensis]|uniref:hypothetical protein n=1 Tax=Bacilliculturomica massiliensis TaxID=1917867 RepID=UPI001030FC01|nr:hypothetical protein [Bacilliculturomica massiliensis]
MSIMLPEIAFVVLLCVPVAILAGFLLIRLMDEYIRINQEKKEEKERRRKAAEQQNRRRRGYYR